MNSHALSQTGTRRWQATDRTQERALVDRAQAGDAEAFARLYERIVERIYRYIFFRVPDDATAEDLTSEVFIRMWEHLPRYRPETSTILSWVYTIAHNAVIDYYRVHKTTQPLDDIRMLSSPEPLPAEQSETRFESQAVRQAMQYLTDEQRDVLTMRFIEGMETNEIAVRIRKSEGAVRAVQMRGLHALSRLLRSSN